jgi:tRNA pseudouridine13 synthase
MSEPHWFEAALSPPRAFGSPVARGRLRVEPEDFVVEEDLGFVPSGAGQHVLLKVRKRDANTEWVARELARSVGCRPGDVGFAGLKDRRAIAVQWFSVPQGLDLDAWRAVRGEGFEVLEAHAHSRKLPRGALAGNRFWIRVRDLEGSEAELRDRLDEIARRGVPNYFGPQRFGRNGGNLNGLLRDPGTWKPSERSHLLSTARSLVFNAVLAERVRDATWDQLEAGDLANLDGRGSIFAVDSVDAEIVDRCRRLDIHPTGPLWGDGPLQSQGRVNELETRVAAAFARACDLTVQARMQQERRSLRLAVRDLEADIGVRELVIRFRLMRGSYATAVMKEIVDASTESGAEVDL